MQGSEGSSMIAHDRYTQRLLARIDQLEAENILLNELVSDQRRELLALRKQVIELTAEVKQQEEALESYRFG